MDTNHSPIISPLTMRESARGITLTSIYDEMLARRELSVMGNIETPMAHDLCQQIRLLDATDPSRPITIFVASAGGSVRSGLAIYDAMRLASCPIRTVCLEFAASMGAVIFMGGDDRRMAPHAELMIHDPLIPQGTGGSALALQETSGVSCRPARPSRKSSRTAAASRPSASSPSLQKTPTFRPSAPSSSALPTKSSRPPRRSPMSNLASRLAASKSASSTILAKDRTLSCDTRQTGLNNNALVIGPSGAGKTRNVLKPNLLQMNASYIVLDTKGTLCREVGPVLAAHGYRVQCLNFADLNTVPALAPGIERCGYNPLRHIRRKADGRPNQQDILSVAKAICPIEDNNQPFWDHAAANLLSCLIAYVTEQLPADEQTISSVIKLIEHLQDGATGRLFDDLITTDPQSYALSLWRRYAITQNAERMHASIVGILAEKVMCLGFDGAAQLYRECHQVDFASMGHTPCALFVTVSDIDRNLDPLTDLFITQAFMGLIREADRQPDGSLPVPVRFMLDDFANLQIPQIDNVLSIIRSRNIWATLLLQSTNQLDALYGEARARSIMGNCDTHLVLAFQDPESARVFSDRADALPSTLMATPIDRSWLFVRGRTPEQVERLRLEDHPLYGELPEAQRGHAEAEI